MPVCRLILLNWLSEKYNQTHEKRYSCPYCSSKNVIRRGVRRGKLKYWCKDCCHWFQINRAKTKIFDTKKVSNLHFKLLLKMKTNFKLLNKNLSDRFCNGVKTLWRRGRDSNSRAFYGADFPGLWNEPLSDLSNTNLFYQTWFDSDMINNHLV